MYEALSLIPKYKKEEKRLKNISKIKGASIIPLKIMAYRFFLNSMWRMPIILATSESDAGGL
jgi:hypothetical protein